EVCIVVVNYCWIENFKTLADCTGISPEYFEYLIN
ncbi:unnamed protein product, partial [Tenebrio molitor]